MVVRSALGECDVGCRCDHVASAKATNAATSYFALLRLAENAFVRGSNKLARLYDWWIWLVVIKH